mgnify:CR=1 FL=1
MLLNFTETSSIDLFLESFTNPLIIDVFCPQIIAGNKNKKSTIFFTCCLSLFPIKRSIIGIRISNVVRDYKFKDMFASYQFFITKIVR